MIVVLSYEEGRLTCRVVQPPQLVSTTECTAFVTNDYSDLSGRLLEWSDT